MVKIDKTIKPIPFVLSVGHAADKSAMLTEQLCTAYDAGNRSFSFEKRIYGDSSVKQTLIEVQHDKCCFCESYVGSIAHGDVEHFRPKGGFKSSPEEALQTPGYYWLAYAYDNLYFVCQVCNQSYKKNYFPLSDATKRVRSHHQAANIKDENPMILNPGEDDPEVHIFFNREVPVGITDKGTCTIDRIGLDREKLNNHRMRWLTLLDDIARHAASGDAKSLHLLREAAHTNKPYSLMVKCNYQSLL